MPPTLAIGIFFVVVGLAALAFGVYALLRGGREHRGGGIGPFSERGLHVVVGLRMTVIGVVASVFGVYVLWSYFG